MVRIFTILAAVALAVTAEAQAQRVLRTQFKTYDTREDALARRSDRTLKHIEVDPAPIGGAAYVQEFTTDVAWSDCNAYLHLENVGSAYTLVINGKTVAEVEDDLSPAEFMISDLLVQGKNTLVIFPRESRTPQIQNGGKRSALPRFADSYIFAQRKIHVDDFAARLVPDSAGDFARFHLDVAVVNNFNYEEPIAVGYDITSPSGRVLDYAVREIVVPGRSRDTIRITTPVYDAKQYVWNAEPRKGDAPLYAVTLYVKRNGRPEEYIPFNVAYGEFEYADGKVFRLGREVEFVRRDYAVSTDRKELRADIAAMKREGVNTLVTEFPQPEWFYDECDRAGIFVLDRAAINAVEARDDRSMGGTPSNDPSLVGEYADRADAMYYRMRNHPSVAGFVLGGETGNGYAMYKAYQHLKSLEERRPVICDDARGEWNSDL